MTGYAVVNPATGETEAEYASATDADVQDAIQRAHAAHRVWRSTAAGERGDLLRRVAAIYRERAEELSRIIVREMGKPIASALEEVNFAADITDYYADNVETILRDEPITLLGGEGTAVIRKESLGVLLGIMPWNFPFYQIARFAAPNLLIGNTIILKQAPQCPESAAAIEEIHRAAGLPDGAYINIYASNQQAADIIADPRVQGVSLTGSERAGSSVAATAGEHLKKVALELGGSDAFIFLSADNLDSAVDDAVAARLDNSGQACNGAKRFVVLDEHYDVFLAKVVERMSAVTPGDPMDPETTLGPLSSEAAAERLERQVSSAVEEGANLVLGGTREGAFFTPTVLTEVTPEMAVYREELFGPAVVVYRVADEEEAVRLANDTPFGLGSYVYTTDQEQADRVADGLTVGMVYVNIVLADSPELPFGGVKRSGTGRELGLLAADEFVNKKLIRVA